MNITSKAVRSIGLGLVVWAASAHIAAAGETFGPRDANRAESITRSNAEMCTVTRKVWDGSYKGLKDVRVTDRCDMVQKGMVKRWAGPRNTVPLYM